MAQTYNSTAIGNPLGPSASGGLLPQPPRPGQQLSVTTPSAPINPVTSASNVGAAIENLANLLNVAGFFGTSPPKEPSPNTPTVKKVQPIVNSAVPSVPSLLRENRDDTSPINSPSGMRTRQSPNPRSKVLGARNGEVVDYSIQTTDGKEYVVFRANIQLDGNHWTIHRRYNDFADLHHLLIRELPPYITDELSLPPKRFIKRRKFDTEYLEKRRKALDSYLKQIMREPELCDSRVVCEFLSNQWRKPKRKFVVPTPTVIMVPMHMGKLSNAHLVAENRAALTPRQLKRLIAKTQQPRGRSRSIGGESVESIAGRPQKDVPPFARIPAALPVDVPIVIPHPRVLKLRREFDPSRRRGSLAHGTPPRPNPEHREQGLDHFDDLDGVGFDDTPYPTKKLVHRQASMSKDRRKVGKTSLYQVTDGYSSSENED